MTINFSSDDTPVRAKKADATRKEPALKTPSAKSYASIPNKPLVQPQTKTEALENDAPKINLKAHSTPKPTPKPVPKANANRPGLLKNNETDDDQRLENRIRPQSITEYIGQSALKENLKISTEAAKNRNEPMEHVLLYGPPGLGKTTLAMVLANEMGTDIQITSAPALERPRDILGILMSLEPGSVLFIDEIHRMNKVTEEILYPAMEDFTLDRTIGKGHATKIVRVPLPAFTLIGATTKAGSISSPLRDRFGLVYRLNYYTIEEMSLIIERSAGILEVNISSEGINAIARRSRSTPRIANRLLRRVRDFLTVRRKDENCISGEIAEEAMNLFGIDEHGLDTTDHNLLRLMIENFNGGPVGVETLASTLGEDPRTLEDVYEPYLLQSGLINRTPRGRVITPKALRYLNITAPEILTQASLLNQ